MRPNKVETAVQWFLCVARKCLPEFLVMVIQFTIMALCLSLIINIVLASYGTRFRHCILEITLLIKLDCFSIHKKTTFRSQLLLVKKISCSQLCLPER